MNRKLLNTLMFVGLSAAAQFSFAQSGGVHCPSGYESEFDNNILRCAVVKKVYVYPVGHDFGNASTPERGVKCPADGNDRQSFSGGRLTCTDVKNETKSAYCTIGWTLQTVQGQDICRSVVGNNDPTLPEGTVSRDGWNLLVDHNGNKDSWRKTTTRYEFPVAR